MTDHSPIPWDDAVPWDEAQRLHVLRSYGVLDTPPEPDFDDVVHLAAHLCDTPVAAISLIEDRRQWFKAEVGLGVRETPVQVAFCSQALLRPGLTVVRDAQADPRFAVNPLVTGHPRLRFYAGARLDTPNGVPLGALCVLDYAPRDLSGQQRQALTMLARQVMLQLELRHAVSERDDALAARRQADQRHDLLVRELHHRNRNQLAVLQAMLGATVRASGTAAEFYAAFSGRIAAMARTQALLTEDYWQTAPLRTLLRHELQPFVDERPERVVLDGPDLHLSADLAVPLSMVLHELATAASRHGTLSATTGRLHVTWDERTAGGRRHLRLEWREVGGPSAAERGQDAVGLKIHRMLELQCEAEIRIAHEPAGFRFTVSAPLVEKRLVPEY